MNSILLALAGWMGGLGVAAGADWYVSPGGNDGAAGTLSAPFRTVSRGLDAAQRGNTVYVRAGTYGEALKVDPWETSGFALAAYPGEAVTIAPPAGTLSLTLSTVNGFEVRGIRFTSGGINVQMNSSNVVFTNCVFNAVAGDSTVRINGARNVKIAGCWFTENRAPVIVSVVGATDNLRIENNTFLDNYSNSGELQATILATGQVPTEGIRIVGNTFRMTRDKSTRPVLPSAATAAAIMLHQCQGGSFPEPKLTIADNVIEDYRFRGTNDDTRNDPTFLKTPEQGGEQGDGISLIESSNVRISGNQVSRVGTYGLIGHLATYLSVTGNGFRNCGLNGVFLVGDATLKAGASPNLIAENRVFDSGWLRGGTSGISTIYPGPGNLILRNFVSGQRNGIAGTVGASWYGDGNGILADLDSNGTFIVGNVVVNNEGAGISINRASDSVVAHNTVVGNGSCPHRGDNAGIFLCGETGPSDRVWVVNNLLYNNRTSQLWVWKTALDHTVRHNVFAWGPLTVTDRRDRPIDWYGHFFSVSNWVANPPRAGNGAGDLGVRPVFLGDLVGGNPKEDPLWYLPVNASAGVGDAASRATLPAWTVPAGMEGTPFLETALSLGFSAIPRPTSAANRGALEPPVSAFPITGGGSVRLRLKVTAPTRPCVWAEHLTTWLEWRDEQVYSADYGFLQPTADAGWVISQFFGYTYHGVTGAGNGGWVWTERFGWMSFVEGGNGSRYLWVHRLQSWLVANPDGSFFSFDFGSLIPVGPWTRYSTRIGMVTAAEDNPLGWLVSDRFGFVWFARDGTGVWFWSTSRGEWLGITSGGGIWSTAEGRFI